MPDQYRLLRRTTLKDIAESTGFSVNTVSHALKDKDDISEPTRLLIRRRAEEMGYVADMVAGSMRSGTTRTIALILGDVANPHFGLWAREIEGTAFRSGYSTIVIDTDEDEALERDAIRTAVGKRVDGIVICPTQRSRGGLEALRASGVPFVLVGRRWEDPELDYVVLDDTRGGLLATRHLLERGHRRILFLSGPDHISSARERLAGYRGALREAGLEEDPALVRTVGVMSGGCGRVLRRAVEEGVAFTAVVAFSDIVALEALRELARAGGGAQVPVVGFDDIASGLPLPFATDSVASAQGSPAELAARTLLERIGQIRGGVWDPAPKQTVLPVRLFHREMPA